jgi:hypothetical protein
MMHWGLKFSLYIWKIQYNVSAEAGNSWVLLVCLHAYLLASYQDGIGFVLLVVGSRTKPILS